MLMQPSLPFRTCSKSQPGLHQVCCASIRCGIRCVKTRALPSLLPNLNPSELAQLFLRAEAAQCLQGCGRVCGRCNSAALRNWAIASGYCEDRKAFFRLSAIASMPRFGPQAATAEVIWLRCKRQHNRLLLVQTRRTDE